MDYWEEAIVESMSEFERKIRSMDARQSRRSREMSIEYCCECDQATGNAGRMDGSLFAAHQGPFCEDCWGELPGKLAEENEEQATTIALQLTRIAELEADAGKVQDEAEHLAMALWKRHYREASPDFGLCDSTAGIISQIDNMSAGMSNDLDAAKARNAELEAKVEAADLRRAESETTLWARIAELEAQQQWIAVDSGVLPDLDVPVLVISEHWPDRMSAAMRMDEGEGWLWAQVSCGSSNINDVMEYEADDDYQYSHWMHLPPLPTPPEPKE